MTSLGKVVRSETSLRILHPSLSPFCSPGTMGGWELCLLKCLCYYYIALSKPSPILRFITELVPMYLSYQDVGLNTDAVVFHSYSTSCHSDGQTKSLAFPLHHRSSRESSHGHSLSSQHQSIRSIQVFSTSSKKHPGEALYTIAATQQLLCRRLNI